MGADFQFDQEAWGVIDDPYTLSDLIWDVVGYAVIAGAVAYLGFHIALALMRRGLP